MANAGTNASGNGAAFRAHNRAFWSPDAAHCHAFDSTERSALRATVNLTANAVPVGGAVTGTDGAFFCPEFCAHPTHFRAGWRGHGELQPQDNPQ